jgi:cephalosporin hydroxylase
MELPIDEKKTIDDFHKIYYNNSLQTWDNTRYFGIKTEKCPLDLWIYQEILFELKPDYIIETGTRFGGSALFMAHLLDTIGKGEIFTIDIEQNPNLPKHKRIKYLSGSSTSPEIIGVLKKKIKTDKKVLLILDSDHSTQHVSKEIELLHKFVSLGSYLIVEDSNICGNPVNISGDFGIGGPMVSINNFLQTNKDFVIDLSKEKFFLTFNPNGYLKKIA